MDFKDYNKETLHFVKKFSRTRIRKPYYLVKEFNLKDCNKETLPFRFRV